MVIRLKQKAFAKLQGFENESQIASRMGVSRAQLWRIKRKKSAVGSCFIAKFKIAFPKELLEDYFTIEEGGTI